MSEQAVTIDGESNVTKEQEYVEEYLILINHEEQYSIWPSYKPIPAGWKQEDNPGPKQQCLDYIEKHWTDMRPLSLRKQMAELEKKAKAKVKNSKKKAKKKETV